MQGYYGDGDLTNKNSFRIIKNNNITVEQKMRQKIVKM